MTFAIHAIRDLGYGGIMLMIICSAVIAVPGTEAPMLFAGFNVYQHHLTMLGIIGFGVLGDVIGATIAYIIGFYGLHVWLNKLPGPAHVDEEELEKVRGWFAQYGPAAVFVGRLLPLSLAADHRVVDGSTAAQALAKIIDLLQNPDQLMPPAR